MSRVTARAIMAASASASPPALPGAVAAHGAGDVIVRMITQLANHRTGDIKRACSALMPTVDAAEGGSIQWAGIDRWLDFE